MKPSRGWSSDATKFLYPIPNHIKDLVTSIIEKSKKHCSIRTIEDYSCDKTNFFVLAFDKSVFFSFLKGQIGINLGTKHVLHQKLVNFMYKNDIYVKKSWMCYL